MHGSRSIYMEPLPRTTAGQSAFPGIKKIVFLWEPNQWDTMRRADFIFEHSNGSTQDLDGDIKVYKVSDGSLVATLPFTSLNSNQWTREEFRWDTLPGVLDGDTYRIELSGDTVLEGTPVPIEYGPTVQQIHIRVSVGGPAGGPTVAPMLCGQLVGDNRVLSLWKLYSVPAEIESAPTFVRWDVLPTKDAFYMMMHGSHPGHGGVGSTSWVAAKNSIGYIFRPNEISGDVQFQLECDGRLVKATPGGSAADGTFQIAAAYRTGSEIIPASIVEVSVGEGFKVGPLFALRGNEEIEVRIRKILDPGGNSEYQYNCIRIKAVVSNTNGKLFHTQPDEDFGPGFATFPTTETDIFFPNPMIGGSIDWRAYWEATLKSDGVNTITARAKEVPGGTTIGTLTENQSVRVMNRTADLRAVMEAAGVEVADPAPESWHYDGKITGEKPGGAGTAEYNGSRFQFAMRHDPVTAEHALTGRWVMSLPSSFMEKAAQWGLQVTDLVDDASAQWRLDAERFFELDAQWGILTPDLAKDLQSAWELVERFAFDRTAQWFVNAALAKALAAQWLLRVTPTPFDKGAQWLVTSQDNIPRLAAFVVSNWKDAAAQWRVHATILFNRSALWRVNAPADDDTSSLWRVNAPLLFDHPAAWMVLTHPVKDTSASWELRIAGGEIDKAAAWSVLAGLQTALAAAWRVAVERSSGDTDAGWVLAFSPADSLSSQWVVRSTQTASPPAAWTVGRKVPINISSQWTVQAVGATQKDAAALWRVKAAAAFSRSTQWGILLPGTAKSLDAKWLVSRQISKSTGSTWHTVRPEWARIFSTVQESATLASAVATTATVSSPIQTSATVSSPIEEP